MSEFIPRVSGEQKLSDPKIAKEARLMYYSGVLPVEIAQVLKIPFAELKDRIFGKDGKGLAKNCWYQLKKKRGDFYTEKDGRQVESVPGYEKVKYYLLKQTEARLLRMVERSLDELEQSKTTLYDIDAIKKALETYAKLDGILRLEEGKPTERIEISHGLTLREVSEKYGQVIQVKPSGEPSDP